MILEHANESHIPELISLANDPEVIKWSNNVDTKDEAYYKEKIGSDDCYFYILMCHGELQGYVRFDVYDSSATMSYALIERLRGKGMSRFMTGACLDRFLKDVRIPVTVKAEVKNGNESSEKVMERLLQLRDKDVHKLYYERVFNEVR